MIKAWDKLHHDGKPFFQGAAAAGRIAYVTPISKTNCLVYGVDGASGRVVFALTASIKGDLRALYDRIVSERARVEFSYVSLLGTGDAAGKEEIWEFVKSLPTQNPMDNEPPAPSPG